MNWWMRVLQTLKLMQKYNVDTMINRTKMNMVSLLVTLLPVKLFFRTFLNLFSMTNYRNNYHKFLVQNINKCLDSSTTCRYTNTRTRPVQTGRNPEYEVRL